MPSVPALQITPAANSLGIADLAHAGDHDRADGDHGGRRRARQRREQHAGEHRGDRQPALEMADAGDGEADDAARHTAGRHEGRGQDEERDGEQRVVAVEGVEQGLGDRAERGLRVDEQEDDRGQAERDGDRHADQA